MRIRTYLSVLVVAALMPLLVFAVIIVQQDMRERHEILNRGMDDTARALSLAIDGEIKASLATLETLASSPFLDDSNLQSFHELSRRVMEGRKDAYIILFDGAGTPLVNSSLPFGSTLPNPLRSREPADSRYPDVPLGGGDAVREVLRSARPAISDLFISLVTRTPRVSLDIPVMREGRLRYVLEMSIDAQWFARLLSEQVPPNSVLAIVDRRGIAIARSLNSPVRTGKALETGFAGLAGSGAGKTAEGMPVHNVLTRSQFTGWTISLGTWTAAVFRSQRQALAVLAGGAALALLLGLAAAFLVGRRIAGPISLLARSADAISRGDKVSLEIGGVREVEDLHRALTAAGDAARQSMIEREHRLIAEESERRFRLIADAAPVLIWMSGADRLFTWCNKGWLNFVGRTMSEELGSGWTRNVHPDDLEQTLATYGAALYALEPFSVEYRLRRHDGEYRWIRNDGVPRMEPEDRFAGYICACVDVTDFKRAAVAMTEASRHKDEFLAMLSHELRNPLAALTTAAYLLRTTDPASAHAAQARAVIGRQTDHMAKLIGDLLDVSRLTMGKADLAPERFDLGEAVRRLAAAWRTAGRFAGHEVVVSVESAWVHADRTRVEQIVVNLLDNALKFTPPGGTVRVGVRAESAAVLTVVDGGQGIAAQDLERIFEPFAQAEQGIARSRGGMGLGLAIVKRLAEMHGGTVAAASEGEGHGAALTVRLPLAENLAPRRLRRLAAIPVAGPRRVLIIEDNADMREMLRATLAADGHEVREAADGAAGLAAAHAGGADVALIDIGLPDIDGYEVARRLRTANLNASLLLIALTGYGQPEDRDRALAAGFDAHLTKPIGPERVKQAIAALRAAS